VRALLLTSWDVSIRGGGKMQPHPFAGGLFRVQDISDKIGASADYFSDR
jgi:hypothetical protein